MSQNDPLEAEARSGTDPERVTEDEKSEVLDDDKLVSDFPPDQPLASNDYGVTPAQQRIPEPIDERVRREKPESATVGQSDDVGRLVAPDEGQRPDDERSMIADDIEEVPPHDRPVGDVGTGDTTTYETATELSRDVSAEEAAVHEREEPR
jgi:hypothetical protein